MSFRLVAGLLAIAFSGCMPPAWAQTPAGAAADRLQHWGAWADQAGHTFRLYGLTPTGYQEVGRDACKWVEPGITMECLETGADGTEAVTHALGLDNRIRSVGFKEVGHAAWDWYEDGSIGTTYTRDNGHQVTMRTVFDSADQATTWLSRGGATWVFVSLRDDEAGSAEARIAEVAAATRSRPMPTGPAVTPGADVFAPLVGAAEAASLQSGWGPLAVLAGHDWVHRIQLVQGHDQRVPTRFAWVVPGRVLEATSKDGRDIYRLAPDGTIVFSPSESYADRSERTLLARNGALVEYLPPDLEFIQYVKADDKRVKYIMYPEPNGQVSRWFYSADRPDIGTMSTVYVRADGSTGQDPQVIGPPLRNPSAWGPLAALANRTMTSYLSPVLAFRVAEGGDVMHVVRLGTAGATPETSLTLGGGGTILMGDRRIVNGKDVGRYRVGYIVDGQTVEWRYPGSGTVDSTWSVVKEKFETKFTTRLADSGFTLDYIADLIRIGPELLAPALAQLAGSSSGMAASLQAKADAYQEMASGNGTNEFLGALSRGLDIAGAVVDAAVAESQAERAANVVLPQAQAPGSSAASGSPPTGSDGAAGTPATVLLAKGFLRPITPGATSNEMCFAMVHVGPVGTGHGREGEARQAAAVAEQRFLAACRELGPLTSGNVADEWYVDDRAESAYARLRGNRWMHEVVAD